MEFSNFFKSFLIIFLFIFGFSASSIWVAPSGAPTGGMPPTPINTSIDPTDVQEKIGGTIVAGGLQTLEFKFTPGAQQNYVLISDADGDASWVDPGTLSDGGGNVNGGGSGTVNFLTKWLDPATITNSQVFDNGTNVGIGTTTPSQKLDVNGNVKATQFCLPGTNPTGGCIGFWPGGGSGGGGSNGWTDSGSVVRLTTSTDKVGIGTNSPSQQLTLAGNFEFPNTNSNGSVGVFWKKTSNGTPYRFIFNTSNTNSYSIFAGRDAGSFSMNNSDNIGIGHLALSSDTNAFNSIGLGSNTAISGSNNIAIGNIEINGDNNVGISTTVSSPVDIDGDNNTAVGHQQGIDGSNNTAIGEGNGGNGPITGSNNTALGRYADNNGFNNTTSIGRSAAATLNNEILFGHITYTQIWGFGVHPAADDAIRVGTNASNGNGASLSKTGAWTSSSDRSKKHDIEDLSYGLEEVLALRPVEFKWNGTDQEDIGFIAQEVEKILPELVMGEEGDKHLSYSQINVVLANAVQDLKDEQDELITELDWLEAEADRQGY